MNKGLTKKQLDVLALLAKGYTQTKAADTLHVSAATVRGRYDQARAYLRCNTAFECGFKLGATMAEELKAETPTPRLTRGEEHL